MKTLTLATLQLVFWTIVLMAISTVSSLAVVYLYTS